MDQLLDLFAFDADKVPWADVVGGIKFTLAALAKGTDTPLDDKAIDFAADIIIERLKAKGSPTVYAAAPLLNEDGVRELAAKFGLTLPPFVVAMLVNLAASVVEKLLERWAKK